MISQRRRGGSQHLPEQRVQGVLQLHGDALQRAGAALAAQQVQRDRLVVPEHLAGRQLRGKTEG